MSLIVYFLSCVATYYYCRWSFKRRYPKHFWGRIERFSYMVLSLASVYTLMWQTIFYWENIIENKKY